MTGNVENMSVRAQRTRRNMLKVGAVLASASLAGIERASATSTICGSIIRPSVCKCFLKGTRI